jgi:hypothetical protein
LLVNGQRPVSLPPRPLTSTVPVGRRGEGVKLKRTEVDAENSCLRLSDSKEGASIRPIGLPVLDLLDDQHSDQNDVFVFPGTEDGKPLVGFPK